MTDGSMGDKFEECLDTNRSPKRRLVKLGDIVEKREELEHNPEAAGLDKFLKVEHLDEESLKIKRWGLIINGNLPPTFYKVFRKGQVLYPTRNLISAELCMLISMESAEKRLSPFTQKKIS